MKIKLFGYVFTIEQAVKVFIDKPESKKKATGYSSKTWSKKDTVKLIDMYKRDKTPQGMARMLSRTTAAVTSKLWKLKRDKVII